MKTQGYRTYATMRTLRFKFTSSIQTMLTKFAQEHSDDPLQAYRAAWAEWVEDNRTTLDKEIERLAKAGYQGDAVDKMYKAARYYFRRPRVAAPRGDTNASTPRRYITVPKELLARMDAHIATIKDSNEFRPATGFERFAGMQDLAEAMSALEVRGLDAEASRKKLKQTYKNRCFLSRRKEGKV